MISTRVVLCWKIFTPRLHHGAESPFLGLFARSFGIKKYILPALICGPVGAPQGSEQPRPRPRNGAKRTPQVPYGGTMKRRKPEKRHQGTSARIIAPGPLLAGLLTNAANSVKMIVHCEQVTSH